jgi:hypothetical protein
MTDTAPQPPASPPLVAPRDAAVVDGEEVTFVWDAVDRADAYRLQVAQTARFDDLVLDEEVDDQTAVTVGNLFPTDGSTFFWRVRASRNGSWSAPDDVESFVAGTAAEAVEDRDKLDTGEGPITDLARAERPEVTRKVFDVEDQFEEEKERGVAYEGVAAGQIVAIAASILVVILVAIVTLFGWFGQVSQQMQSTAVDQQDYEQLRQTEVEAAQELEQYGVVDGEAGVYQVPIDRAMEIIATEEYQEQQNAE